MIYSTIEDYFKTNGDRHLERAFNHLYCGHPDNYWQVSVDKSLKNYNKTTKRTRKHFNGVEASSRPHLY